MPVLYKPFQSNLEDKKKWEETVLSPCSSYRKYQFRTAFQRDCRLFFPFSG